MAFRWRGALPPSVREVLSVVLWFGAAAVALGVILWLADVA
jgi:hypothetical protein